MRGVVKLLTQMLRRELGGENNEDDGDVNVKYDVMMIASILSHSFLVKV